MNNNEKLLPILEKDFQELSNGEMQVLRNETRKIYGIEGKNRNRNHSEFLLEHETQVHSRARTSTRHGETDCHGLQSFRWR